MDITSPSPDAIIAQTAKRAAAAAADAFGKERDGRSAGLSSYAIYAWACVAFIGSAVASSALVIPMASNDGSIVITGSLPSQTSSHDLSEPNQLRPSSSEQVTTSLEIDPMEMNIGEHADPFPVSSIAVVHENAPTAQFAARLGGPTDVDGLFRRYAELQMRAPKLMSDISPMAQFLDETSNPQTNLLAGPFINRGDRAQFCSSLKQKSPLSCMPADYSGEPLLQE